MSLERSGQRLDTYNHVGELGVRRRIGKTSMSFLLARKK